MIWGILALVIALAGVIYWVFRQGGKKKSLEADLDRERALSKQKAKVTQAIIKGVDQDEKVDEAIKEVMDAESFKDLIPLYRKHFPK